MPQRDAVVLHVLPSDAARGAQVHARALRDALDGPGRRHRLVTIFAGPERGLHPDARLDVASGRARAAGLAPAAVLALARLLRAERPDVVVAHGSEPLKYAAVARPAGAHLVYHAIGVVAAPVHREPYRSCYRLLYRRPEVVACISSDVAEECASLLGVPRRRLVVTPNGRDPGRYRAGSRRPGQPPTVAFVGHLTDGKGPLRALEVVEALRRNGLAFDAVVVGDGPLEDQVRRRAGSAGARVLGAGADVATVLSEVDVLLFPSERSGEGMPGVLIEAGLSEVAAVATDVPGVRDVIDSDVTGVVVPEGDVAAMTEAAGRLLRDPARARRMGKAARRRCAERFSIAASAGHWAGLVDRLVDGGR